MFSQRRSVGADSESRLQGVEDVRGVAVSVRGLTMQYGTGDDRRLALAALDLDVRAGECLAVVGASGAGKTTLLKLLAGLLEPTSGTIEYDGDPLVGTSPWSVLVFQESGLFEHLTVLENVCFPMRVRIVRKVARRAAAQQLLAEVGLGAYASFYPHELSGGMQQRVELVRALATGKGVLLLDEPFGALDVMTRIQMQKLLRNVWQESGKTVVLVTHAIEEALLLGERVLVLGGYPGRVLGLVEPPWPEAPDVFSAEFVALRRVVQHMIEKYSVPFAVDRGALPPSGGLNPRCEGGKTNA